MRTALLLKKGRVTTGPRREQVAPEKYGFVAVRAAVRAGARRPAGGRDSNRPTKTCSGRAGSSASRSAQLCSEVAHQKRFELRYVFPLASFHLACFALPRPMKDDDALFAII